MWDTIVILEEGKQCYPRFPKCDMFVSHKDLNVWHLTTDIFLRGEEQKRRIIVEEESRAGAVTAITAYGIPLVSLSSFK